jgi:hypothetical protein
MKLALCFLIFAILLAAGCTPALKTKTVEKPQLSELQAEACNSADAAGTCTTRLAEIGIVLAEQCCASLGKCC